MSLWTDQAWRHDKLQLVKQLSGVEHALLLGFIGMASRSKQSSQNPTEGWVASAKYYGNKIVIT